MGCVEMNRVCVHLGESYEVLVLSSHPLLDKVRWEGTGWDGLGKSRST